MIINIIIAIITILVFSLFFLQRELFYNQSKLDKEIKYIKREIEYDKFINENKLNVEKGILWDEINYKGVLLGRRYLDSINEMEKKFRFIKEGEKLYKK